MLERKRTILILLFLCLSIFVLPTSTNDVVGDTVAEAKPAILGDNSGSLSGPGASFFFNSTTSIGYNYQFSASAGATTDFDMYLYDNQGVTLDSSAKLSYPEQIFYTGNGQEVTIRVASYSGAGTFTLTISYEASTSSYYGGLKTTDSFYWNVTQTVGGVPDTSKTYFSPFHDGMDIRLIPLVDGPSMDAFYSDITTIFNLDYVNYNNKQLWIDFPTPLSTSIFVLPTSTVFGPADTRDMVGFMTWWAEEVAGNNPIYFIVTSAADFVHYS